MNEKKLTFYTSKTKISLYEKIRKLLKKAKFSLKNKIEQPIALAFVTVESYNANIEMKV